MRILILGVSVRAMAESAVGSKYPIVALDAFGDRDLAAVAESYSLHRDFRTRYSARALFQAGRTLDFDSIAYTANLENHSDILRRFEKKRIIGNSPQTVTAARDWATLFPKLKRAGFSAPETVFDLRQIAAGRRWLTKPMSGGGGHGVGFMRRGSRSGRTMFQEYIPGKPCSASFVANGRDCVLVGITEQLIGAAAFNAPGFRYCGNVLPLPEALGEDGGILGQLRRLASFLTREYGLTGLNGIDFILRDGRVWLTEINPRYSASMELMERAYGLPMFHLHVNASLHGILPNFALESVLSDGKFHAKAILFAGRDATAPDTQSWIARGVRDVPASGEQLRKGGPICTILANGPTPQEALAELTAEAQAMKKEVYG